MCGFPCSAVHQHPALLAAHSYSMARQSGSGKERIGLVAVVLAKSFGSALSIFMGLVAGCRNSVGQIEWNMTCRAAHPLIRSKNLCAVLGEIACAYRDLCAWFACSRNWVLQRRTSSCSVCLVCGAAMKGSVELGVYLEQRCSCIFTAAHGWKWQGSDIMQLREGCKMKPYAAKM